MFWRFDYYYLILVVPAMLLAMWAQMQVSSTFRRFSQVRTAHGLTGMQAARNILDRHGLQHIRIEQIAGELTDHYDPGAQVVRLSSSVYNVSSVAAVGVAAHECGHAVQHAIHYSPLMLRNAIVPITNFGSKLAIPIFLIGLFISPVIANLGLLLFGLVAVFQIVTLPVEFNASARALRTLEDSALLDSIELRGSQRVLRAAALTYVAALAVTIAQLLRLLMIARRNNRN